jgi:vacuolar-type H+-ATPase subunit C/Vma6
LINAVMEQVLAHCTLHDQQVVIRELEFKSSRTAELSTNTATEKQVNNNMVDEYKHILSKMSPIRAQTVAKSASSTSFIRAASFSFSISFSLTASVSRART